MVASDRPSRDAISLSVPLPARDVALEGPGVAAREGRCAAQGGVGALAAPARLRHPQEPAQHLELPVRARQEARLARPRRAPSCVHQRLEDREAAVREALAEDEALALREALDPFEQPLRTT
jgi:hypothetical protein